MKQKIVLLTSLIAMGLMLSTASATVHIVYDDDGNSKTYYENNNSNDRYYFNENGKRCYYDKYGNKKCVNYSDYDYENYEDRYWNKCSYRDYNQGKDVCYYTDNNDDSDNNNNNYTNNSNMDYSFWHYPVSNIYMSYHSGNHPYLKYEWAVSTTPRKITSATLDEVFDFVQDTWYFKYLKFSYYWDSTLDKIDNGDIDLTYLSKKKLQYPIVAVYQKKDVLVFIHKNNLREQDQDTIWRNYYENDLKITRLWSWYVVYLPTAKDTGSFTYDEDRYLKIFRKLYSNYTLLNYQVWENPFQTYYVEDFGNDILQMEIKKWNNLIWLIMSLENDYHTPSVSKSVTYGRTYTNDDTMHDNLQQVFDAVKKFRTQAGSLPDSLGTLNPQYIDFRSINPYNYDLKYYKTSTVCYKVGFKPTSTDFKSYYADSINAEGYFMWEYCVR